MALKSSNKVDTNRYELIVEVDKEEFQKAIDNVYKRQRKDISIPGFRKGKAPKNFIEKVYGEEVFYEDAINDICPKAAEEAIKGEGLEVIRDEVDFEIINADKNGLEFKVKITTKPEVELGNYKGIEIKMMSTDVTDEDVQKEIELIREKNARIIPVEDRSAEEGDYVEIDYKGYIGEDAFEGGEAEDYSLRLGEGNLVEGFEEQIIGHNINDVFDVVVTFPEDYSAKGLAGKEARFEVTLREIRTLELPELDDEFAKDVSEFDTLDEYKKDLKEKLEERKEQEARNDYEDQIVDNLIENMKVEVPKAMYEKRIDLDLERFKVRLWKRGIDFEEYKKYLNASEEEIKKSLAEDSMKSVKGMLALEKVAELENIEVNETEIAEELFDIAVKQNADIKKLKRLIRENNLIEDITKDIKIKKALSLILENAILID